MVPSNIGIFEVNLAIRVKYLVKRLNNQRVKGPYLRKGAIIFNFCKVSDYEKSLVYPCI